MIKKVKIKNRHNLNIVVLIKEKKKAKGLAFIMHGLAGFKEQPQIKIFASAFYQSGYTTVRFDTTNTLGESDGKYEDATVTNYYQDLEDVIKWAKIQDWYKEPFCLAGHSLGAACIALYAEKYPNEVKALAPISTLVSGKLSMQTHSRKHLHDWQTTGWQIYESVSKPGVMKKLKWSHMEDRLKYDLLKNVKKLTMPVLMIVGEKDRSTPIKHQKILYNSLPCKKEFYVIKGAKHTFREREHLDKIREIFLKWIKLLN